LPQIVIAWLDSHAGPLGIPHELQQTIGLVHEPAVFGSGKTAVAVWRQDRPGGVDLVAVDMDFRNAPGEPVTWLEDVGRGEAPCGVLFDDRLCIAYERLTAGKGSVFLCCAARPGGPK